MLHYHFLLIGLLAVKPTEIIAQEMCSTHPELTGPSSAAGTTLFRLYHNFFDCTGSVGSVEIIPTGDLAGTPSILSHWRKTGNDQFLLMNWQLMFLPDNWNRAIRFELETQWLTVKGDLLGVATTETQRLRANVVAAQDTLQNPTAKFDLVDFMNGDWGDVLSASINGTLSKSHLVRSTKTFLPLVTAYKYQITTTTKRPITVPNRATYPVVPHTYGPGMTTYRPMLPTPVYTKETEPPHLCPEFVTKGGDTMYSGGKARHPWSNALALCHGPYARSRKFRCVPLGYFYVWADDLEIAPIWFGMAYYHCAPQ